MVKSDKDTMINYYALFLAIISAEQISPARALQLMGYYDELPYSQIEDIVFLRENGNTWKEIKRITGCRHSRKLYLAYKRRELQKVKKCTNR